MSNYVIQVSPHIRSKQTTQTIMAEVILALCPALIMGTVLFGIRSLLLTVISAAFCVILEFAYEKIMKMKVTISDLSAVVTGILVAFNVPSTMPIWQLLIGDAAAIIVAKMLFGGLGKNFMNPALVGRIVMMFSFTASFNVDTLAVNSLGSIDVLSGATPLANASLVSFGNLPSLLFGTYGGTIGETCSLALLLGGVYLAIRKIIAPSIPLAILGSTFVFTFLFGGMNIEYSLLSLLTGGVLLGSIFMATDYVTSPLTTKGRIIYGIFIGFIIALIRAFGNFPEGVTFGIILANILVPYMNDLTLPKPFGAAKAKKEKKEA